VGGTAITLLPFSLRPGAYTVTWHSVGHDTHRVTGSFSFKVIP
jgi:methionine-rich copper-binding protein CopC